jgi:hypothetical protein
MTEARPFSDWVMISSQARWQGVIFDGEGDPRIVPVPRPANNAVAFNQFWSVQSKGCLVTQKLKTNKGAAEMMVWMSKNGLAEPIEEDDVVFVEAPGAYAAIRVAKGDFTLSDHVFTGTKATGSKFRTPPGYVMIPADEYAPVILEVMAKSDVASFDAFKQKVKACELSFEGAVLTYRSIYGDILTLETRYAQKPTINGKPVNYAPRKVFDSPFLHADYDSGVVTISKKEGALTLDFNTLRRTSQK